MVEPRSISEARLKAVRRLLTKKHRLEGGTCLIEGRRFVAEALARPGVVESLLIGHAALATPEGESLVRQAAAGDVPVWMLAVRQIEGLSDTVNSQGVLAVVRLPHADPAAFPSAAGPTSTVVALDGVADPGNVGTIIRTCAWFGVEAVLLSSGSVELSNPKLLRSTMGAIFAVPVAADVDLPAIIPHFRRGGFRVFAAEAGGGPARPTLGGGGGRRLLVFGSEAHGLSPVVRRLADASFGIPGSGLVESLNVAVSVGISLEILASTGG